MENVQPIVATTDQIDPNHPSIIACFDRIYEKEYYEEYLIQLKKRKKKNLEKRDAPTISQVLRCYGQELIEELKQGVLIWLPCQLGTIQFGLYKGYIPVARVKGAIPSFWVHTAWRKREGLNYSEIFKLKVQTDVGKALHKFYIANPADQNKIKQL